MQPRRLAGMLGLVFLVACGRDGGIPREQETSAAAGESPPANLFVAQPGADAQIMLVAAAPGSVPAAPAGAVFVPLSTFSIERDGIPNEFPAPDSMAALLTAAGVREGSIVIVGEPIPAGRAFAALDYLGLGDRASLLDGGPQAFTAAAAARSSAPPATPAPALEIDPRDDMIVDAEWVQQRLNDPSVALLDARPPAEFSGETPGDGVDRPGHIPGAVNVFWQTLLQSPENPRLKDESELRAIFERAGVGPGDTVVAYCRTGGQASFLYTVARHLGYDVRLYDGSFVDWSRTAFEVERGTPGQPS